MWVALTRQRLLLIERRGLIGFRPRSLPRPPEAQLRPKYSDPWIVAVRASNGETTALVLDWAEAEAMLSAETMPQVAEPTPSQVPPPDVLHDAHVSDPDGDPPHPRGADPPSSVTAVHRRGRKPRPRPGPPRHLAPEPLEPPDAGSRPPTRPDLPATETRTGTGSAGVDAHRPTWSKRARKAARNWFRISIDPITDDWSAATEHHTVPTAVLHRLQEAHPEVPVDRLDLVVAAFMQWVRIEGRHPGHAQPSVAVDSLWQFFVVDERSWRTFCEDLVLDLPYRPVTRMPENAYEAKPVFAALESSFADAVFDEQPLMLPVLFDVDEITGFADGRLYQRVCATLPCQEQHRICLHWSADHALPGW